MFLVVPECAGAFVAAVLLLIGVGRIPDLNLGSAAEVDAAVAVLADFPIDPHFEIAVVARGGEEGVFAVADEDAVFDVPMFVDAFLHFGVARGAFFLRHRGDFFRVFGGAGPVFDVVAVEEGFEAFGGLVVFLCAGGGLCERDLEEGEERNGKLSRKRQGSEVMGCTWRECVSTDGSVGRESFDFSCAKRGREAVGWLQKADSCD